MLTTSRKHIFEKVIARDGIVYRVVFAVSNEFGKQKAEVISVTELGKIEESAPSVLLLDTPKQQICPVYKKAKVAKQNIVSPYSTNIYVSGSKPRAPTK